MKRVLAIAALSVFAACASSKPAEEATPVAAPASSEGETTVVTEDTLAPESDDPQAAPRDVAAAPANAERTASGLASRVLTEGTSDEKPAAADTVRVHYTGWTADGQMFDSSVLRGEPATFPLDRVIKGWTEGVQLMRVGEKRRFWVPADLAYGDPPRRPGAPAGQLTFDVELLGVVHPPAAPADVARAPKDAKKTKSGLAYKVLQPGNGTRRPGPTSIVQVDYTGWTTDGRMFDTTVMRGAPSTFKLDDVIPGWTEGLQLMVEGETTRFWIPAKLAYGNSPAGSAPTGMLVFDIALHMTN